MQRERVFDLFPDECVDVGDGEKFFVPDAFNEDEIREGAGHFEVGGFGGFLVREIFVLVFGVAALVDQFHRHFGGDVQDDVEIGARDAEETVLEFVVPAEKFGALFRIGDLRAMVAHVRCRHARGR